MATGDAWVQVAPQLDFKQYPWDLVEFNNKLYAGISDGGRLFEWNDADAWAQVAGHLGASGIRSLAVYGGDLFGGTRDILGPVWHRGNLYKFTGSAWLQVAPTFDFPQNLLIPSLCAYNGALYGGTSNGHLLRWNGVNLWNKVATCPIGGVYHVADLIVFNNVLYAAFTVGLYKWDDVSAWVSVSNAVSITSLAILGGTLYAVGATAGKLFQWNGVDTLTEIAPHLNSERVFCLAAFDGKLYGGTEPGGKLHEYNGVDAWVEVAPKLAGQNRIQELAVHNGKLYGITQPGGRLFEWNGVITPAVQMTATAPAITTAEADLSLVGKYRFMTFSKSNIHQPFF